MNKHNSTTRFSDRVENYVKYRPGYPEAIVDHLERHYQLHPGLAVADIGAGTGISARLFLENGYAVTGIEPNKEMREAAVNYLRNFEKFIVVDGTAEQTNLPDKSMDMIVAAQAFHWFDKTAVKKEFKRILKPGGWVVLIWNERLAKSGFEKEYDELIITYSVDYVKVDHRNIRPADIEDFFNPEKCEWKVFPNYQRFDLEGLKGRLLSSSYAPGEGHSGHAPMLETLQALYNKYQQNNSILINYDTNVYVGKADQW